MILPVSGSVTASPAATHALPHSQRKSPMGFPTAMEDQVAHSALRQPGLLAPGHHGSEGSVQDDGPRHTRGALKFKRC